MVFKPKTEEIRCPCGTLFIRVNRKGGGNNIQKTIGRPLEYCKACRDARSHGRKYGLDLTEEATISDITNGLF